MKHWLPKRRKIMNKKISCCCEEVAIYVGLVGLGHCSTSLASEKVRSQNFSNSSRWCFLKKGKLCLWHNLAVTWHSHIVLLGLTFLSFKTFFKNEKKVWLISISNNFEMYHSLEPQLAHKKTSAYNHLLQFSENQGNCDNKNHSFISPRILTKSQKLTF